MAPRKRAYEGDLNFSSHGASDICMLTVCVSAGGGAHAGRALRRKDTEGRESGRSDDLS